MTNYCKCGGKVALGMAWVNSTEPDQEPYDNGFIETIEDDVNMKINDYEIKLEDPISIIIGSCVKCGKIYSADVQETFDEKYAKIVEREGSEKRGNKNNG